MKEYKQNGYHYVFDGPEEILKLTAADSWDHRADRKNVFEKARNAVTLKGDWAQFGVYKGLTATAHLGPFVPNGRRLWLFDSFDGLPEPWHKGSSVEPQGKYKTAIPQLSNRYVVVPGLYEDTLSDWSTGDPWGLIDIDCDLYSSTRTVLETMNDRIVPGTVIRFDEIFSYPAWRDHEWKAFDEWRAMCGRRVQWIARGAIYWAACVVTK